VSSAGSSGSGFVVGTSPNVTVADSGELIGGPRGEIGALSVPTPVSRSVGGASAAAIDWISTATVPTPLTANDLRGCGRDGREPARDIVRRQRHDRAEHDLDVRRGSGSGCDRAGADVGTGARGGVGAGDGDRDLTAGYRAAEREASAGDGHAL
jgi:hypothetical protein